MMPEHTRSSTLYSQTLAKEIMKMLMCHMPETTSTIPEKYRPKLLPVQQALHDKFMRTSRLPVEKKEEYWAMYWARELASPKIPLSKIAKDFDSTIGKVKNAARVTEGTLSKEDPGQFQEHHIATMKGVYLHSEMHFVKNIDDNWTFFEHYYLRQPLKTFTQIAKDHGVGEARARKPVTEMRQFFEEHYGCNFNEIPQAISKQLAAKNTEKLQADM